MAITFDPTLATAKDRIRQRVGQTDTTNAKIQDETIAAYIATGLGELAVARQLCIDLAALYASLADSSIDRQLSRNSQLYDHYISLAGVLELEMKGAAGSGAASGAIIVTGVGDCRGPLECWPPGGGPWPIWQ